MPLSTRQIRRIAGLELNALRFTETLGEEYEKVRISSAATPVYDINGELLFYRIPLVRGEPIGYTDVAVHEALGEPLLATSIGLSWDEKTLLREGVAMARKRRRGLRYDSIRFVAYSYPKIALQFLSDGVETLMLELFTWAEVPLVYQKQDRKPLEPANFERWSLLDEMPPALRRSRARSFQKRLQVWDARRLRRFDPRIISRDIFRVRDIAIKLVDTRDIHYSARSADHHVCYELRGQQTNVWCVAASVEMVLNFYRYAYDQVRLAQELGLGTLANPNGLPYARVGDVVTVMENLASDALDVTMHTNPGWNIFRDEIRANRPLVSFVPGHSRTVVGYTRNLLAFPGPAPFRGLLVYDPWPPNVGVITRWENFATQTYQYAYSSVLQHV